MFLAAMGGTKGIPWVSGSLEEQDILATGEEDLRGGSVVFYLQVKAGAPRGSPLKLLMTQPVLPHKVVWISSPEASLLYLH